jgi:hypothetical protein
MGCLADGWCKGRNAQVLRIDLEKEMVHGSVANNRQIQDVLWKKGTSLNDRFDELVQSIDD